MPVEHVDVDDLTDEQREQLEQTLRAQHAAERMAYLRDQIQEEAQRQNRWIERQIWETDFTEVAVVDVVTLDPADPMEDPSPSLKVYRYANPEEAPGGEDHPGDGVGWYGKRAGRRGSVQRITRDQFEEIVLDREIEPPEWLDVTPTVDGDLGPDDGATVDELRELREERRRELREEED